ncbi:PREDICTED: uncharacterized protein LOC109116579 [Tarenaya hassleriana]|uniref:uncharacterized protein LOC109116579 n=1 Tax=Tarenaya hassleriana TaxID=28532 RepID=UPI0008FD1E40|nr:PREDICTED: uncharacterized protein LOC109116579 [Tarenaya hassleriana]
MNMNQQNASDLELDLKLNFLPPLTQLDSSSSSAESSSSSYGLSEAEEDGRKAKSMVVVGCPNCMMYIIMSLEGKPRCPRCNNKVLIDFVGENNVQKNMIKKRSKNV